MWRMIRRLLGREEAVPPPPPSAACTDPEAVREMVVAKEELRKSRGERVQADEVAQRLRKINQENHFAADMLNALRGIVTNE